MYQHDNKGRILIPKVIRDVLGLKEGTPMVIDLKGEKIIIKKKEQISKFFDKIDKKMKEEGIEGIEKIDLDILYDEQINERLKR